MLRQGRMGDVALGLRMGITASTKDLFALTEENVMIGGPTLRGGKTTG
jgi:hypothetical protein